MRRHFAWVLMMMLMASPFQSSPARAVARHFILEPGTVMVGFRAYGLGLLAIDGHFTRFHGTLTLDDQDPTACSVSIEADAASLAMPSASMTADAQGPDLLDVAHYPDFKVNGQCANGHLQATLLLHGISRPLVLDVTSAPGKWEVAGLMRRADWGMGARPLLAGPEVRISLTAGLPASFKLGF